MRWRCYFFGHDETPIDMRRGTNHVRRVKPDSSGWGEDVATDSITGVLYQCRRCRNLRSQVIIGHWSIEKVHAAQEAHELTKLVDLSK
jgi:hypothetical protein